MKRNSRIIFKHSFGQFIEDNVGPPQCGMQSVLIGTGRDRGERVSGFFEPKFNEDVFDWRNRSLKGAVGEACPCSKYISNGVTDEEMAWFRFSF